MFNLLVSGNGEAWEANSGRIGVDRFKEFSGAEADAISIERVETLRRLEEVPTLLMYELSASGPNVRLVRHGLLRNITRSGSELTFKFAPDPKRAYLNRGEILEFADLLGMHRFEQHRTHWAVKDGELPAGLLERAVKAPPDRTVAFVAKEYALAVAQRNVRQVEILKVELTAFPPSAEKAVAALGVQGDPTLTPDIYPHLGLKPGASEGRASVEAVLARWASSTPSPLSHFSMVLFLETFGTRTEAALRNASVRACQEEVMRLSAAGEGGEHWPDIETIGTILWRCARSPLLSRQLRRRYRILVEHLANRQSEYGGWEGVDRLPSARASALATVALQRLGDDKYRSSVAAAVEFLLEGRLPTGALRGRDGDETGDIIATVFGLEAFRRAGLASDISHVFAAGEEWLFSKQTPFGLWQADGWEDVAVTGVVLDYLDRKGGMLPQVDGFLLMARDFFRKAEELQLEDGTDNRRLAAIAAVHAMEMFLYGVFERRPDLGLSAYRENGGDTLGPREGLGALQAALRDAGTLVPPRRLAYRDQLTSLIRHRDDIIHHAHEISASELHGGIQSVRRFIEEYGSRLINIDLLQ